MPESLESREARWLSPVSLCSQVSVHIQKPLLETLFILLAQKQTLLVGP